jgi:protein SCO1/2
VEENNNPVPGLEVAHTPRFVLVDPKGQIRGYYDSSDSEDVSRLRADVQRLTIAQAGSG